MGRLRYDPADRAVAWPIPDTLYVAHVEHYSADDVSTFTCEGSGFYAVALSNETAHPLGVGEPTCWVFYGRGLGVDRAGRVAYASGSVQVNRSELIRVLLRGGTVDTLHTGCAVYVEDPEPSPDGSRVAFRGLCEGRDQEHWKQYVVRADGSGLREMAREPGRDLGTPAWSPDGARIAYGIGGTVVVMDTAGGGRRALVRGGAPAWSPDARWLAYMAFTGDDREAVTVRVVRTDGTGDREVWRNRVRSTYARGWGPLREGEPEGGMVWSPDGEWIAFSRRFDRGLEVWRVHVRTGELRRVTRSAGQLADR